MTKLVALCLLATLATLVDTTTTTSPKIPVSCKCTVGKDCKESKCSPKTSEGVCIAMAEDNTLNGTQKSTYQTCQDSAEFCNATISFTLTKDVYWRSKAFCCNSTDDCNADSLQAPPANTTASEMVCPSCFALNASSCTPTHKNCSASETKCIDVTGMITNGPNTTTFVGKGCATATAKSIKKGTVLVFGNTTYTFTTSTLTDDASGTPGTVAFAFLLSTFVALLQAKFIY